MEQRKRIIGARTFSLIANLLFFIAPKWFLIFTLDVFTIVRYFIGNKTALRVNNIRHMIKNNHCNFLVLRKLGKSKDTAYYKKYLSTIIFSFYNNWQMGISKSSKDEVIIKPVFAAISITEQCNLKCKGCFAEEMRGDKKISREILKLRIEEFIKIGTRAFVIIGGEPLTYPDIIKILSAYPEAIFFIYTNATLINNDIINILANSPNIIMMLSIEGPLEITDQRRGNGVFARVMESHVLLSEYNIMHGLSFTVTRKNLSIIAKENFLSIFDKRFIVLVQYIHFMKHGYSNIQDMFITHDEIEKFNSEVRDLRFKTDFAISNIPEDELRLWGHCPAGGQGIIHIKPDGQVQTCIFSKDDVFNSSNCSVDEVLSDERLRRIRSNNCQKICGCRGEADVSYSNQREFS